MLKPGLELMRVLPLDKHLNESVWGSRGWTLQEHYLSRRMLNFVNDQVYFRCRQRIWCEETWSDRDPNLQDPTEWTTNLVALVQESMDLEVSTTAPHTYWFTVVSRFQQRNLTDENDAANALMGILQRVGHRANTIMPEGLPIDIFPLSLLFCHLRTDSPRRRPAFASWSWEGWVEAQPDWYAFNALESHPEEVDQALELSCVYFKKYHRLDEPSHGYEDFWKFKSPNLGAIRSILSTASEQSVTLIEREPLIDVGIRPYEMLSVIAITITLKARRPTGPIDPDPSQPFHKKTWALVDRDNHECGFLYHDTDENLQLDEISTLILLSKCYRAEYPLRGRPHEAAEELQVFWVMFVVPMGDCVHERRGIGEVLQSHIPHSFEPGVQWRKFVLG